MKYAVCYDTLYVFNNLDDLKQHFGICYYSSDGAEQQRYASILINSDFKEIAMDNVSDDCKSIAINNYNNSNKNIFIQFEERKSIVDSLNYFNNLVKPILNVCEEYNVNFSLAIPFEDFGSDRDSAYGNMYSISNFYEDILEKFGINVESIETDDKSDGKYEITINNKEVFDTCAWEKLEGVIDNIESLLELLKSKEGTMEYE